ncbi:MAG TPA: thioredoxin [Gammaproteobacteria bacterium]|nr:thioredoxin [Gammaproteobacteria bacterium]
MPALIPLDEFTFHQQLAQTPGVALVVFTSQGCGSCRAWKQMLADDHTQHPDLTLFEVDAGHALGLAREFNVFHLPALFLYQAGHYHGALQCEARPDKLKVAITALLASPAQEAP